MNLKKISGFIVFISLSIFVNASDSALLQKRIEKIRTVSQALTKLPEPRFKEPGDTVYILEVYKNLVSTYFTPPFTTPEYNISFELVSLHRVGIDSLILRYPDARKDSIADVKNLAGYLANTIIGYVNMYDEEWELFYFAFKEGTDQLIYLIVAGGEREDYRRKKQFLDKLHSVRALDIE